MSVKILLAITISIKIIDCLYLEAESNYLKPKLERNNIVNKGIWIRNKHQEDLFEQNNLGNFIFRPISIDVDNVMQNNFDAFGENAMQETPFVSNYIQRARRSPDHIRKRRPRKSMKASRIMKNSIEDSVMIKSKLTSDLKPSSVFNEYPYEVAILLNDESKVDKNTTQTTEHIIIENQLNVSETKSENNTDRVGEEVEFVQLNTNATLNGIPKRSKKHDYDTVVGNDYNAVQEYNNKTGIDTDVNKQNRDIFHEDDKVWNLNTPLSDSTVYKVVTQEPEKPKSVTERGLIKVISMLTKTFKKIMKQHGEIKDIHNKLTNVNEVFDRKVAELTAKFEDFDSKYSDMIQFNDKIRSFESQLNSQNEYFETKKKAIHDTLTEFQNHQKKFLAQQRQFYGIQKLMLTQNEKINAKQNLIAKTQSEISHRQNNFARILKKAKQIINDNKTKVNHTQKQSDINKVKLDKTIIPLITTPLPPNTQAMKINLFSIPSKSKLENQDDMIIKEKDDKQIDDLVYKFYFNNTFIDNLMKSKILNNYATNLNSVEIVSRSNQVKNKRDEFETTIMLPINNNLNESPVKRERRWINHFSKNKYRKLNRHRKETTKILNSKEADRIHDDYKQREMNKKKEEKIKKDQVSNEVQNEKPVKNDPFMTMASNFCNEIGQNANDQMLKWCIEKALRRLKFMAMNAFTPPPVTIMKEVKPQMTLEVPKPTVEATVTERNEMSTFSMVQPVVIVSETLAPATTFEPIVTPLYAVPAQQNTATQAVFFPDNDELESNLKQYDLKPDTEGNVYYEGSVHISDYGRMLATGSDGTSDIMPGLLDSNSRIDIDPMAFDLQAKRRAYVRRINENILKQMKTA